MARLAPERWPEVRALYEAGGSSRELGAKFGVSRQAIEKRAQREGWTQDVEPVIRRMQDAAVAGVVAAATSEKKAEAMHAEAERRAEIIRRHRQEWLLVANLRQESTGLRQTDLKAAFDRAKLAKITAEMTAIQQAGERRAWGIDAADANPPPPPSGRFRFVTGAGTAPSEDETE